MAVFDTLWSNYPLESQADLFNNVLGGGWPALLNNPNYANTCTVRLSVTFSRSGLLVPVALGQQDGGLTDQNGNSIATRVPTGEQLVRNYFGDYFWGISHNPGDPIDLSQLPSQRGILIYRVNATDASGHIDLWDGSGCRFDCHAQFAVSCYAMALWSAESVATGG
jgi:hypothetical protein